MTSIVNVRMTGKEKLAIHVNTSVMQILVAMVERVTMMEIHSTVRVLQNGLEVLATLLKTAAVYQTLA